MTMMFKILFSHSPILQVLFPLFAAIFSAFVKRIYIARSFAIIAVSIPAILIVSQLFSPSEGGAIYYALGNWPAPIGIEYRIDIINNAAILYVHFALLYFLIFHNKQTQDSII